MIFEQDLVDGSNCHQQLRPAVELWHERKPTQALMLVKPMFRKGDDFDPKFTPVDWLFMGDVAASCGFYEYTRVLTKWGFERYPQDRMLSLYHAWDLSAAGKFFQCQKLLSRLSKELPEDETLISALKTYNFSLVGWRKSAQRSHAATMKMEINEALTWYVLARAAARRSEWDESIEAGIKALQICPTWSRVRSALMDSYLAVGNTAAATKLFEHENLRPYCALDFSRAMTAEASGDTTNCKQLLSELVAKWPRRTKVHRFSARHLTLLLLKENKFEQAEELIRKHRIKSFDTMELKTGDQKLIPVPLVSQNFNHCVPTVAAMVANGQNYEVTPMELAKKMDTRNGTPMFRMVDEMKAIGFRADCVKVDPEIVQKILEQDVPLIGTLNGLFNSHVDVICGFHAGMKMFHLRDPMHWFGYSMPYDKLEKHYVESGGLWVLTAPDRIDDVKIKDEWRDHVGQAYIDLNRACLNGHRKEAEEAYKRIPDDHELATNRDGRSNAIVISPKQFLKNAEKYSVVPEGKNPTASHMRAMLCRINEDNADEIYEFAQSKELDLNPKFIEYIHAQCLIAKHDWTSANKLLTKLTRETPGMEQLWSNLSLAQLQLGKLKEAKQSLRVAIDIAPDNDGLRNRVIDMEGNDVDFKTRLQQVKSLLKRHPDRPEHYYQLARVMREGSDGKMYENSLKKCLKFFPRDPELYFQLASWYLLQGRTDLLKQLLSYGRKLLGEEELPKMDCEKSNAELEQDKATPPKPPENENRFDRLIREVSQHLDSQDSPVSYRDLVKLPQIVELKKINDSGQLTWTNSVLFHSAIVNSIVGDHSLDRKEKASELKTVLPTKLPGIPERYANVLLDSLPFQYENSCATILKTWVEDNCPDMEKFADLQLNYAFVLEKMGLSNDSETELRKIVEKHPAYAPVFFRLGQIFTDRNDLQNAIKYHQQCLNITPGNFGAIDELLRITGHLQTDDYAQWLERASKLFPYSQQHLYQAAVAISEKTNAEAGEQHILAAENFPDDTKKLLAARLWADRQNYDRAIKLAEPVEPNEEQRMLKEWIVIEHLMSQEKFVEAEKRLSVLHEENPKDVEIIDQLARLMRLNESHQVKAFAIKNLNAGSIMPLLCFMSLADEANPGRAARLVVENAPAEHQENLVHAYYEAFSHEDYMKDLILFLDWAHKSYPALTGLRAIYATRLSLQRNDKKSIKIAKELLDEEPNNPQWLGLMGNCIQDSDPNKSIEFLKKEFAITGSAETLCRLGRGFQLAGKDSEAKNHYMKCLAVDPYNTLAITNLIYRYSSWPEGIFDNICEALRLGYGGQDEYFHVIAVKAAHKFKQKLPTEWLPGAVNRLHMALHDGGFDDEIPRLRKAIVAWAIKNKIPELKKYGGFLQNLQAKYFWPKMSWIPEDPPNTA